MKVNILLCDTFPGILPEYIESYESMFVNMFRDVDKDVETRTYYTYLGELPSLDDTEGLYLITGSNAGAYDKLPWIKSLLEWIRKADERRIKLTGICFGHQCVAQALGGKVVRSEKGWGIGARRSVVSDPYLLNYFKDGTMTLLYNHHDQVAAMPESAECMASSEFCPCEAMRIGNHIMTFQGHPEFTTKYLNHLLKNFSDNEPEEVRSAAQKSMLLERGQGAVITRLLLDWASNTDE